MASNVDRSGSFISDILAMITSGTSNDVKIVLNDGEIVANKDVLSARSDYFETMFSNTKFIEGETKHVFFNHCSKAIMEKIIKYLFSGKMKLHDLSMSDLVTMMNMTTMMLLDDLKSDIQHYILEIVPKSGDNCPTALPGLVESLMLAEQFKLDTIKKALVQEFYKSLRFIPEIPDVVKNADAFKHLPYNLLKEILICAELDGINEEEELQLQTVGISRCITTPKDCLDAFVLWLSENDCTTSEKHRIRDSFDLDSFDAEELLTDVRKSGLYSIEEIDRRLLEIFRSQDKEMEEVRTDKRNAIKMKDKTIDGQRHEIEKLKRDLYFMKL